MSQNYDEILGLIDNIAQESLILEPGDLKTMGLLLNMLDKLPRDAFGEEINDMELQIKNIILADEKDRAKDIESLNQKISAFQEKVIEISKNEDYYQHDDREAYEEDYTEDAYDDDYDSAQDTIVIPLDTDEVSPKSSKNQPLQKSNASEKDLETGDQDTLETEQTTSAYQMDKIPEMFDDGLKVPEIYRYQDIDKAIIADFVDEANEHLQSLEVAMLNLESEPDNMDILNSIFRVFHTIKGNAGFLNLNKISEVSHNLETILDETRKGRLAFTSKMSDVIFDSIDILKVMMIKLNNGIVNKEKEIIFDTDISDIIRQIKDVSIANESNETSDAFDDDQKRPLGEILMEQGIVTRDDIKDTVIKQIDGDTRRSGEIFLKDRKIPPKNIARGLRQQTLIRKTEARLMQKTIKVDTNKMDFLLDMVGELVITNNMIMENPSMQKLHNEKALQDLSQLKRITNSLQRISMSLRMIPILTTFQKMSRIVRDLSKKSSKNIELTFFGESTEIDRNIVEELYDPLLHMIRNSCDHGIEATAERLKSGKDPKGNIILKAYNKGSNIIIEIEDDGKGIDTERIRQKGIEKGLLTENDDWPKERILDLIFHPGFSTAKKVTEVSGRGVGMDVVRKVINKLGGAVEISTELEKGSKFLIKLPLTLAIMDGMLVAVGKEKYIIPVVNIKETIGLNKDQFNLIAGKGETVRVRGRILPLIRLHDVFGIDDAIKVPWEGIVVVCENEKGELAILVDDLIRKQEVVIKGLGESLKFIKELSGGAILGDGTVGLILDINNISMEN